MKISVREAERLSLEQIRAFLEASEEVHFEGEKREEIYGWVSRNRYILSRVFGCKEACALLPQRQRRTEKEIETASGKT